MTTIEGLGKKFQDARLARGLTLDEAARMTKIRPSRLAEIEGDDFSQFPSLAYAKGFLLIYGKFLEVDVTPYMEAFETSDAGITVDGYSYLQDNPTPAPARAPIVRRRPTRVRAPAPSSGQRTSIMPLIFVPAVIIAGFLGMKFILNLQRLGPQRVGEPDAAQTTPAVAPSLTPQSVIAPSVQAAASVAPSVTKPVIAPPAQAAASVAPSLAPSLAPVLPSPAAVASATAVVAATAPPLPSPPPKPLTTATAVAKTSATAAPKASASAVAKTSGEPEVRRAEPVRPEDLASAGAAPVGASVAPKTAAAATAAAAAPVSAVAAAKTAAAASASPSTAPKTVAATSASPSAAPKTAAATSVSPSAVPKTATAATSPSPSVAPKTAAATSPAVAPSATPEAGGPNRVAIKSVKKTYVRVVVDDEASTPAYERWLSPSDEAVEFRGKHINIKVLERDALQIKKNGKSVSAGDDDVTVE